MRQRFSLSVLGFCFILSACQTAPPPAPPIADTTVRIKEQPHADFGIPTPVVLPSLSEMQGLQGDGANSENDANEREQSIRLKAMRDAALSYGAQGGLAWCAQRINEEMRAQADKIGQVFNFKELLVQGPEGSLVAPPIISEARDSWSSASGGQELRIADRVYEIISAARFVPTAPVWQTYLVRSFQAPQKPFPVLLPKNADERRLWKTWVAEGWNRGVGQGQAIFAADLARLERDMTGMIRYRILLAQRVVTAPHLAVGDHGVTGNGDGLRVRDRSLRITATSKLVQDSQQWRPSPFVVP
jgi:defect-in-organelle-trafficking protein DotC